MNPEITKLTNLILEFRDARNWKQYHNTKDLALCLNIEAGELLELFLWKKPEEVNTDKLKNELGDVFYSLLLLAHEANIDIVEALFEKMKINEAKYPVDKSYGKNEKYTEF